MANIARMSQAWVFTVNNPASEYDLESILTGKCKYAVFQYEKGELRGTTHIQGYVFFNSRKRGSTVKKLFNCNPWVAPRAGTHSEAKAYASKEGTRLHPLLVATVIGSDEGIPEGQGARTDIDALHEFLDTGASMIKVSEEYFSAFIRHQRGITAYRNLHAEKRMWEMEIMVLVGPTGTGKTRKAYKAYSNSLYSLPPKKGSGCYWDYYDGEETVLIDECYGNRFSYSFLLQLLDRWPLMVPNHGGYLSFSSHRIILTSNTHPKYWYKKMVWKDGPLQRRMTQGTSIIKVDNNYDWKMPSHWSNEDEGMWLKNNPN